MEKLIKKVTSQIATRSRFLEIYTPKAMRSVMQSVTTIQQAKALKTHSIAKIRKEMGSQKTEALIKVYLINLNDLLNLKRPLTEAQIEETASEVVATYYHLSMADVNLIMKRAKTGQYGDFYESINMPKVMRWFSTYFEERCEHGARASLDHHSNVKEYNDISRKNDDELERNEFRKAHSRYITEKELQSQSNKNSGTG